MNFYDQNQSAVRITGDVSASIPRGTTISPAIQASFTAAQYIGGIIIEDSTKLMAILTLHHQDSLETPIEALTGSIIASPNNWTTAHVAYFTFDGVTIGNALPAGYLIQVTVYYLVDGNYESLGSACTSPFYIT